MFRNYFKTAWRDIKKYPFLSFIFGLPIGITYDKYPAKTKNIYRINLFQTGNCEVAVYPNAAIANAVKNLRSD